MSACTRREPKYAVAMSPSACREQSFRERVFVQVHAERRLVQSACWLRYMKRTVFSSRHFSSGTCRELRRAVTL